MKTYLKNYTITEQDVTNALESWMANASGHKNSYRIAQEYGNAHALVTEIYEEIINRNLQFKSIHRYNRTESINGKVRKIGVESIKQQIVDYLVCILLTPLFDAKIGFYQVASMKGKGQKLCRIALNKWVKDTTYHVKMDIRQCYPSTSHDIVRDTYRKYVKSDDVLYVIDTLLSTYDTGLEIGSYFSMQTMQFILSSGYHYVENLSKIRRGKNVSLVKHQIWYMDDILLMATDKRDLKMAARALQTYLSNELKLNVKPWKICKTSDSEPLDLGGFVVRKNSCTIRSGIFLRGIHAFKAFAKSPTIENARRCASYWGWFKNSDSNTVIQKKSLLDIFSHARKVMSSHDKKSES